MKIGRVCCAKKHNEGYCSAGLKGPSGCEIILRDCYFQQSHFANLNNVLLHRQNIVNVVFKDKKRRLPVLFFKIFSILKNRIYLYHLQPRKLLNLAQTELQRNSTEVFRFESRSLWQVVENHHFPIDPHPAISAIKLNNRG